MEVIVVCIILGVTSYVNYNIVSWFILVVFTLAVNAIKLYLLLNKFIFQGIQNKTSFVFPVAKIILVMVCKKSHSLFQVGI